MCHKGNNTARQKSLSVFSRLVASGLCCLFPPVFHFSFLSQWKHPIFLSQWKHPSENMTDGLSSLCNNRMIMDNHELGNFYTHSIQIIFLGSAAFLPVLNSKNSSLSSWRSGRVTCRTPCTPRWASGSCCRRRGTTRGSPATTRGAAAGGRAGGFPRFSLFSPVDSF